MFSDLITYEKPLDVTSIIRSQKKSTEVIIPKSTLLIWLYKHSQHRDHAARQLAATTLKTEWSCSRSEKSDASESSASGQVTVHSENYKTRMAWDGSSYGSHRRACKERIILEHVIRSMAWGAMRCLTWRLTIISHSVYVQETDVCRHSWLLVLPGKLHVEDVDY